MISVLNLICWCNLYDAKMKKVKRGKMFIIFSSYLHLYSISATIKSKQKHNLSPISNQPEQNTCWVPLWTVRHDYPFLKFSGVFRQRVQSWNTVPDYWIRHGVNSLQTNLLEYSGAAPTYRICSWYQSEQTALFDTLLGTNCKILSFQYIGNLKISVRNP